MSRLKERLESEFLSGLSVELQAGPRCRKVSAGLRRLGAHPGMLPFYDEHAVTDPRHGKDWLDNVVAKDFRTWGSTTVVTELLATAPPDPDDGIVLEAIDAAAAQLGNTRAMCRSSYVHQSAEQPTPVGALSRRVPG